MLKITDYIKKIAEDSAKNHRWYFKDFYRIAYDSSVNVLKNLNASPEYLNEWSHRNEVFSSVLEYYCLMANNKVLNNIKLRLHIKNCNEILDCTHTHELFMALSGTILSRLCALNPNVSYQKIAEIINNMDDAIKILLQEFLKEVGKSKVYQRIEEEFQLVEEIETLRKSGKNEGNNSSN
jgi:hypothetical protein